MKIFKKNETNSLLNKKHAYLGPNLIWAHDWGGEDLKFWQKKNGL